MSLERPEATFDNVEEIVRVLEGLPDPLTVGELLTVLNDHFGVDTLSGPWLRRVIDTSDDRIQVGTDGLVRARTAAVRRTAPADPVELHRPLRCVAVDFETLPRHRADGTVERLPLQAAAMRFGSDIEWVTQTPPLETLVATEPALAAMHPFSNLIANAVSHGLDAEVVADRLISVLDGADLIVAYNGTEVDIPVLGRLLTQRAPDLLAGVATVDGMYLAHAIWPRRSTVTLPDRRTVSAHTLEAAAYRAGVWRPQSHDALDDCRLLVEMLTAAAAVPDRWASGLADVVYAATRNSHAWALLADLAPQRPSRTPRTAAEVRAVLTDAFTQLPPQRSAPAADSQDDPPVQLQVGDEMRTDGRVDPYRLVAAIRAAAVPRPAQQATATAVRGIVDDRSDGLVEAPTGSGKSLVLLAEALEWVAAGPHRRAVISTYTKQLQTQLADDLDRLADVLPGLDTTVDLVKGASNRLSLRSLAAAITALATGAPHRTGISPRLAADPSFAELVVYLVLRLLATSPQYSDGPPALTDVWAARSVDRVDLPSAFDRWTDGALPRFLVELSQGRSGDWQPDGSDLAVHTLRVAEALRRRRIIVANHALLCSTASVFADMSQDADLLLLIDEAHELETAATSTMSATLDYSSLEALVAELETIAARESGRIDPDDPANEWSQSARRSAYVGSVSDVVALLRSEQLPGAIASAFGMRSGADLLLGRTTRSVAVADEDADGGQLERAGLLERLLRVLVGRLATAVETLDGLPATTDPDETDELEAVRARLVDTLAAAAAVHRDLAEILGVTEDTDEPSNDAAVALMTADAEIEAPLPGQASNRIVWATEAQLIGARLNRFIDAGMSLRLWPFTLTTTPVVVADDPRWQMMRDAFDATVFTSGTLQVPGADDPWAFIRGRLGLNEERCRSVAIPSDFRPEEQALLVAFSDFPSWTEQPRAAAASVAWQVDRLAREAVTVDGNHGALVITTSRAAAGVIADRLVALRRPDDHHGIHSAILSGNAGATNDFRDQGGVLMGTRGLWQGIDLPADRLGMVWINKLPFPPMGDPVLEVRRRRVEQAAVDAGDDSPELVGMAAYYLPLAAMSFRQAVGRLLRSHAHRGVVVVSDSKLSGEVRLRRLYRRMFLGSLDDGWVQPNDTGELGAYNITTMEEGWRRIWNFLARDDVATISTERAAELSTDDALAKHIWLPETRRIRAQRITVAERDELKASGRLANELIARGETVGGALNLADGPITLKAEQRAALTHLAEGRDVLGILPTGFGKSFLFQLPGLILPGVTVVVSPLVSLMTDQALKLNRTVGGQVRALTGPMRESNSRLGKAQVFEQLTGQNDHDIQIVYLSPERLATARFQHIIEQGVKIGVIRLIAFDEAHTLAAWGDSFRPSIRRAEHFVRRLRDRYGAPQLLAVTATATYSVRHHLLDKLFNVDPNNPDPDRVRVVTANPIRSDLATYKRLLSAGHREAEVLQVALAERMLDQVDGHAIVYCTTIKEVERIHGYLSGQTGRRRRVLKYHGRMDDLEKASVADFFAAAPHKGDPDGYKPMVVVATQAFGLGIDRDDIRLVLCASPPGDLSALYQGLGRAGRDQANLPPADLDEQTVGAAVLTPKAWSTLRWMNRHDPATGSLIDTIATEILHGTPPLDVDGLVGRLIHESVDVGRLPETAIDDDYRQDAYRSLVVRTFAALADRNLIDDLGDAPVRATILEGGAADRVSPAGQLAASVLASRPGGQPDVELNALWESLPMDVRDELGDIGSMWYEIQALHATGHLDVSERANVGHGQTANYRIRSIAVTPDLEDELLALQRARVQDLQLLREWFQDDTSCALEGLADYFGAPETATDGICDHTQSRCSTCWQRPAYVAEPRPPLLDALLVDLQKLRSSLRRLEVVERRKAEQSLEELLVRLDFRLGFRKIKAALTGEEYVYTGTRSQRLHWKVTRSRAFGQLPHIGDAQLTTALDRLVDRGKIVKVTAGHGGSYYQRAGERG